MADRESGSGFAIGFVVGAVVGVVVGLLFAPRPGEETREILVEKGKQVRDKSAEVAAKAKKVAAEAVRKAQAKLDEVAD
ncbi:MAG: YtxH domain-containing protein [Chloroflexi bacterium]|nr:YtxH domain-containing protein [Chloroflexota bacterium]MBM3174515.1 YtxH domain-containing protein [Chloroflexota bacterium]MBM4449642.1 YtxH domain-containing protein [Chloroflexota bacterium]